jgi:hypothetical protein
MHDDDRLPAPAEGDDAEAELGRRDKESGEREAGE